MENEAKSETGGPGGTAALSFCLQLSGSLSLRPSVRLSVPAHTMCPLDCHLQSDPKDQDNAH